VIIPSLLLLFNFSLLSWLFDVFAADVAAAAPLLHFLRRRGLAYKKYGID